MDRKKNQEISEEVKQIAPVLAHLIPEPLSYDIPEGYFEKIEDHWVAQFLVAGYVSGDRELQQADAYFTQNEETILHRLTSGEKKRNYVWMYAAASLALLIVFVFFSQNKKENTLVQSEELAIMYLEDNLESWSIEEMVNDGIINETIASEWSSDASPWIDSLSISQ